MAGVLSKKCSRCGVDKPEDQGFLKVKADKWAGTYDQFMCHPCNALASRVGRMLKHCDENEKVGFQEITVEERRKFYKDASLMCGPELRKTLSETIVWSTTVKKTWAMENEGKFRPLMEVREELANKPDVLANLEANAPRMEHEHTKEEMILVTSLKMMHKASREETEHKKRELESEKNIQGVKKAKLDQVLAQAARAEAKTTVSVVVPEAQKKKLTNLVPKAQELQFQAAWQPLNLLSQYRFFIGYNLHVNIYIYI